MKLSQGDHKLLKILWDKPRELKIFEHKLPDIYETNTGSS